MTCLPIPSYKSRVSPCRSGLALVMTFIILAGVAATIVLAVDRSIGAKRIMDLSLARQRALNAAESGAAMVESQLAIMASSPLKLETDITASSSIFWNLRGYCDSSTTSSAYTNGGLYIGGCLVRWRLEPVRINARTADTNGAATGSNYTINAPASSANTNWIANKGLNNDSYYHFRIVTEAYALADQTNSAATPWVTAGQSLARVQIQRVTQLKLTRLFRYALFYAARTPVGDIDFASGTTFNVLGNVHSNGVVYIGGGWGSSAPDYHTMAGLNGVSYTVGSASSKVTVTGVDGVFRTSKNPFYQMYQNVSSFRTTIGAIPPDPYRIPLSGSGGMTGTSDLNGDNTSSTLMKINNVNFLCNNDSRTPTTMRSAFGLMVRDHNIGATYVNTLTDIPELGGRPFEPHAYTTPDTSFIGNPSNELRQNSAGEYTLLTGNPVYQASPSALPAAGSSITVSTTLPMPSNARIVCAQEMLLFRYPSTVTGGTPDTDIWRSQSTPMSDRLDDDAKTWQSGAYKHAKLSTYLPINRFCTTPFDPTTATCGAVGTTKWCEQPGYYLERGVKDPDNASMFGLVIRERGRQNVNWTWTSSLMGANQAPPSRALISTLNAANSAGITTHIGLTSAPNDTANIADFVAKYQAYMKSQYAVYFGTVDITDEFFSYTPSTITATTELRAKLIATEDFFVNRREGWWMSLTSNNKGNIGWLTDAMRQTYKSNTLTLNWGVIQQFLQKTYASPIGNLAIATLPTLTTPLNITFNGLLYVHRTEPYTEMSNATTPATNKYSFFHPVLNPNPSSVMWAAAPQGDALGGTVAPRFYFYPDQYNTSGGGTYHLGGTTTAETGRRWGLPTNRAVRLYNAKSISYGGTGVLISTGLTRQRGLTVVTPNHMYLWGDVNNPWATGATPPAALTAPSPIPTGYAASNGTTFTLTPVAILADTITALSNSWNDMEQQYFGTSSTNTNTARSCTTSSSGATIAASNTTYCTSVVINVVPTDLRDTMSTGSGEYALVSNNFRFLESWTSKAWNFLGSMVVLNRQRSTNATTYYLSPGGNNIYAPPARNITFNTDLFNSHGTPPFTPFGIELTRVISTVNYSDR